MQQALPAPLAVAWHGGYPQWRLMGETLVHLACRLCSAQAFVKEVEAKQHDLRYCLATVVPKTQQTLLGAIAICKNA